MKFRIIYPVLSIAMIAIVAIGLWKQHLETSTPPGNSEIGTVVKVADGDTLTIEMNGIREKTRLCGIDSPEKKQPLGMETQQTLERIAVGKQVAFTPVEISEFGQMLGL